MYKQKQLKKKKRTKKEKRTEIIYSLKEQSQRYVDNYFSLKIVNSTTFSCLKSLKMSNPY